MRVNVYAEELSDRIEIISKTTKDGTFTGLRIYLELPVTVCSRCRLPPTNKCSFGGACTDPVQVSGPFMHHPGDDDSSAVTFWGKRDLREMLVIALERLKSFYGDKTIELDLDEADRQLVLLALAVLSLESPGFDDALNRIAMRIDNPVKKIDSIEGDRDRAEMYDSFREARRKPLLGADRDGLVALLDWMHGATIGGEYDTWTEEDRRRIVDAYIYEKK